MSGHPSAVSVTATQARPPLWMGWKGWDGSPARRITEGQAEARWEALAGGFGWAVQLAAWRAVGLAEAMRVEEEARGGGELEEGMAAVDEVLEG